MSGIEINVGSNFLVTSQTTKCLILQSSNSDDMSKDSNPTSTLSYRVLVIYEACSV